MVMTLLVLSSAAVAVAGFGPNVRIDHQYLPNHACGYCAIAVGPGTPSNQPLYVTFQDDSGMGVRADIWFQKSLDGGRTWLPEDRLIRRGNSYAYYPDITTDSDGNVYIVYLHGDTTRNTPVSCVRSSDGGATWTAPARVDDKPKGVAGWARIAADSAGSLFCAWNDWRTGSGHIWSSVSTDQGVTWRQNVQVDDDTTDYDCFHADVFVQPGTNHYLVTAQAPRWVGGRIKMCAYLYRSTDRGLTFQPGVQLDTFDGAGSPHVVADRDHIICDYFGDGPLVEARTFYTQSGTWGTPSRVADLDSLHSLYYSGELALSGDGRVHTTLIVRDTALYHVYYTSSADHGVSWSDLELVDEDTTLSSGYPDIGADSAGHAYAVWPHGDDGEFRIWFATNNPAAIAEQPVQQPIGMQPSATVVRGVLVLGGNGDSPSGRVDARYSPHFPVMSRAALLDISGREVMELRSGANDVRALAPGVYFVREVQAHAQAHTVRKVVVTR
jgi:hypothetical protein